jgi:pre-mRNA-processing factor 6
VSGKSIAKDNTLADICDSREALQELLAKAVQYCPRAEVLWLMAAKEKWLSGDIASAKDILTEAFEKNPDSESIWLAAAKLASETGQTEAAMQLLAKARKEANTDRVSFIPLFGRQGSS